MPSDVSQAVEQDQIAESLLGTEAATEETQPAGAEAQEVETEETQTVEGELETESEETADDWLPTEQEKVFPADVLAKYAPRYGFTAEELEGDPRIARIVQDKLNSDIYINQLQSREEETDEVAEPLREEPTQPQMTVQQHLEYVGQIADSIMDKDIAMAFATQLFKAGGGTEVPTPEVAMGLTKTFTVFALNLLNTALPGMMDAYMPQAVEKKYEGFTEDYESRMLERAWDKVTSSDPRYAKLPAFTVRGSRETRQAATESLGYTPQEFEDLRLADKSGKLLSPYQNAVKKYSMLARAMSGQQVTSQEAKTFVEAGKKAARQQQIRRETGNLGSGKSNGQISGKSGSGPFQTNNDLFDEEAMSIYRTQHGTL